MIDTNILILRRWIQPDDLPDEMAISAISLAELSAGPHEVRPDSEQVAYREHEERVTRCRDEIVARHEPLTSAQRDQLADAMAVAGHHEGLSVFDRTSEFLIADYPLRTLRTSTLSELLGLGDSVEIGGHTYPLEAGGYDVPESALHKLAGYLDDPQIINQQVDFQVAFYSE